MRVFLKTPKTHVLEVIEVETLPRVGDVLEGGLIVMLVKPPQSNKTRNELLPIVVCRYETWSLGELPAEDED